MGVSGFGDISSEILSYTLFLGNLGFGAWLSYTRYFNLTYVIVGMSLTLLGTMFIKVIKEYERAVIFRLGRIAQGGAKGPGLFFILPCIDNIVVIDLRTVTFDVILKLIRENFFIISFKLHQRYLHRRF